MRALASSELTDSGWKTSSPISRAASATGGGCSLRPRPRGRSGRVTTSAGECGLTASRRRTATANSEVPMKTVRKEPTLLTQPSEKPQRHGEVLLTQPCEKPQRRSGVWGLIDATLRKASEAFGALRGVRGLIDATL